MALTSAGIGSGLDVEGIISKLMAVEQQPLQTLDRKEAALQARLSAYGSLKGAVSGFQSSMQALSGLSRFRSLKATSGDSTIFTASAGGNAVAGNHSIEVKQLAQAQKLASTAFTNTTDTIGTGTLTVQFGTVSGGVFTANSSKAAQSVTIDSGKATLAGIRDAINAARIGVTAGIVNDGTGNRLVISSDDTGAANSLKITVTDTSDTSNTDNAGLSQLAYDPAVAGVPPQAGKNLTETQVAQNAVLKVDGIDNIQKSGNVVTDVVEGVTLTLLQQSATNVSTSLAVTRDSGAVKSAVQDFVKAYNDINQAVKDLTAYDSATKQAAVLQGDSAALSVLTQIRRTLSSNLTGLNGSLTLLSQAGVSFQKDGSLALDGTKLQSAIDNSFDGIAALFASTGRSTNSLIGFVSSTGNTQPGSYSVTISQQASQGALNGAATASLAHTGGIFTAPFTIDATNDTFSVTVDGVASGTITLAQGSYATAAALTAEIQTKVNGDANLKAAGVSITASFDTTNSRLVLTSDRYGSASTVAVTAVDTNTAATLGLSVASGTAGVDVAGTINGVAASGSGRMLTGAAGGAYEGLKLEVQGGSSATIDYSQGYATLLDRLATQLLATDGTLDSRTTGVNASIKDLDSRRAALTDRLAMTEQRLRAQFTALDSLVARLHSTSDFLTRQLASLPGGSSSGK